MGFQRKLKRSYFYMFVIPALIIVLIAVTVLVIVSERYEQQLENISDEAILTAAVQSVWGMDSYGDTATVTVHLNRIREKIEDDSNSPKYLQTIWGAGYRFRT